VSCTNIYDAKNRIYDYCSVIETRFESRDAFLRTYTGSPPIEVMRKLNKEYTIIAPSWMVASMACPRPSHDLQMHPD